MARTLSRGLVWTRLPEALRDFLRRHGRARPIRAAFTTFDFDAPRFVDSIHAELARRNRRVGVLVLADEGAVKAKLADRPLDLPPGVELRLVRALGSGVFHPKVFLVRAGREALAGIGSANLTAGGLGGNLELCLLGESSHAEGKSLVRGVAGFLDKLAAATRLAFPDSARDFLGTLTAGIDGDPDLVMTSLDGDLLGQVASRLGRLRPTGLAVVSPWHAGGPEPSGCEPAVVRHLGSRFRVPLSIYTEGQQGKGPDLGPRVAVHVRSETGTASPTETPEPAPEATETSEFERRPMRVHAKAYRFVGRGRREVLFLGSANCTAPALLASADRGGNVEALVGLELSPGLATALDADLGDLFRPATGTFAPRPTRRERRPRGVVLMGTWVRSEQATCLELICPGLVQGKVRVSAQPRGPTIELSIRDGLARSSVPAHLVRPRPPQDERSSLPSILYERLGPHALPFPVTEALFTADPADPLAVLDEHLREELGLLDDLPPGPAPLPEDDGGGLPAAADPVEDEDLRDLARADHQGRLDRLACRVAHFTKAVRRQGVAYAARRIEALDRVLSRLGLAPGLKATLRTFVAGIRIRLAKGTR